MRILRRVALPLAAVLLVLATAAELGGRVAVERISEDRLRRAGIAGDVDVTVGRSWWRPSVVPALVGGELDRVSVRLRDATMHSARVEQGEYVLEGLAVAISLRGRTVGATSLERGGVSMLLDPASIAADLGVHAVVEGGRLLLGRDQLPATLAVEGDDLVVRGDAVPDGSASMPLVDPAVFPCTPEVRVTEDRVLLHCTGNRLPGVLGEPLGPDGDVVPDDLPLAPVELEPPATLELDGTAPAAGEDGG